MLERLNPTVIGCALNVVGLFFLASAISFKRPRRRIEELLAIERRRSLLDVREQIINQTQVYLGFGILVVGFVLLMSEALERDLPPERRRSDPNLIWIVVLLVVATLGTTLALKLTKELYARRKFRSLLREVLRESSFNLEKNPQQAVQIGELLHIPKQPDQSVADYIAAVRRALGGKPAPAQNPPGTAGTTPARAVRSLPK